MRIKITQQTHTQTFKKINITIKEYYGNEDFRDFCTP